MYELRYTKAAEKYLKKLKEKELKEEFRKALQELSKDPFQGVAKIGDLAGLYGYDIHYHKTGYEIAYQIMEEEQLVVVILAGSRENFYHELKRYMY